MNNQEQIERIQKTILDKIELAIKGISNYSMAETDKNSAVAVESLVNAWAELEKTKEAEND